MGNIIRKAKNMYKIVDENYITKVGGTLTKTAEEINIFTTEGDISLYSNTAIDIKAEEGVTLGEYEAPPEKEVEESVAYKLESTYIHDHIVSVAKETVAKFNSDNKGIVYKMYKEIADGKVANPLIVVSKKPLAGGIASYNVKNEKIVVWEQYLKDIEKFSDRKIKLTAALTTAYGQHINNTLKEQLKPEEGLEVYDYDLFKFDAPQDQIITIGKIETPSYQGDLEMSFPKQTASKKEGPGDPPFNWGFKFSYSLHGGFSASLYAGVSQQIARAGDLYSMATFNAALTYYGKGAPGTSALSPNLVNLSGTPSLTMGYLTGNALDLNLFNSFSGSAVQVPYEYAFSFGATGVLSSGHVTSNYDKNGNRIKDKYNSHDTPHRHQILGGAGIKIGNFMISSYNDIHKLPLFLGMNSDQYWSAGVNIQAKLSDKINMAYAFDLYYGKSNNKNPYSLDKQIAGQNYDFQRLYDVLLNRGQETFSFTDANGMPNKRTKFGHGTFWPSNKMHDAIPFPEIPKKPVMPVKPSDDTNEKLVKKYKSDLLEYKNNLKEYNSDLVDYNTSITIKPSPTFHHLYVMYNKANTINIDRFNSYIEAEIPKETKQLEEFFKLEAERKKIIKNGKK